MPGLLAWRLAMAPAQLTQRGGYLRPLGRGWQQGKANKFDMVGILVWLICGSCVV